MVYWYVVFFFFQAEDVIRVRDVTGVQTCALPISAGADSRSVGAGAAADDPRAVSRTAAADRPALRVTGAVQRGGVAARLGRRRRHVPPRIAGRERPAAESAGAGRAARDGLRPRRGAARGGADEPPHLPRLRGPEARGAAPLGGSEPRRAGGDREQRRRADERRRDLGPP